MNGLLTGNLAKRSGQTKGVEWEKFERTEGGGQARSRKT